MTPHKDIDGPPQGASGRSAGAAGVSEGVPQRVTFSVLCAACLALATGYAWISSTEASRLTRDVALPTVTTLAEAGLDSRSLLFRHTGLDRSYGLLAVDRVGHVQAARRASTLRCERVHFAGERGVCLAADRGVLTTYAAIVFDASLETTHILPLAGLPSRVKVSPDGRRAAMTVFVAGHGYAQTGFSTETSIIDTTTGERIVGNLEEFDVERDRAPVRALDINFWGVTFAADSDRFYASLGMGGQVFLVEGSITKRRMRVLRDGVECPSISPDNTRIAFKKRIVTEGRLTWRLHVLNLATLAETALAETRNVDDQVEWLNDETVLYALPDDVGPSPAVTHVWAVPADGSGQPEVLLREAFSPTVLHFNVGGPSHVSAARSRP